MPANTFIFLSDIHIATNDRCNWYQQSIHEKYLKAILRYVQENAHKIQDLVLLGDWLDLWTYSPGTQPPPVQAIFDANPGIFTPQNDSSGDFVTCMNSIQGVLRYVNGNHDMQVTCAEVSAHFAQFGTNGRTVVCEATPVQNRVYTSGDIYAVHGHDPYALFNRPDKEDPRYGELPLGYFITRTVGLACEQALAERKKANAAQLPDSGNPTFGIEAAVYSYEHLIKLLKGEESFAEAVLFELINQVKQQPADIAYTMDDGSVITAPEAAEMFKNLGTLSMENIQALANDALNTLSVPAKELHREGHKLIVMGHTHVLPVLEVMTEPAGRAVYANSGYVCPDQPGMDASKLFPTFVEIEQSGSSYEVRLQKVDYPAETISTVHAETL